MRLLRITAVALLAAAATLTVGSPAQAGGWATTLLDPLPERLEPGQAYTVGYWVLQHGSHPYEGGDLGKTGLRLTDEAGSTTAYAGVPLAEPAHYATAVVFSHSGRWTLSSAQGIFADYEIGEVTVPGRLRVARTPPPMTVDHGDAGHWGAIRPPLAGLPMPSAPMSADGMAAAGDTAEHSRHPEAASEPDGDRPIANAPLVAGVTVGAVGLLLLAGWRSRTVRHRAGPPSST